MTDLLTLFVRKEPTTDTIALNHGQNFRRDVVFYRDEQCTQFVARWPWHNSPPRKSKKSITLNSYLWNMSWVPDLELDLAKAA